MKKAIVFAGLVALMLNVQVVRPDKAESGIVRQVLATVFDQVFVPQPDTIVTLRAVNVSLLATCPVNMEFRQLDGTLLTSTREDLVPGADARLRLDIGTDEPRESRALVRLPVNVLSLCVVSASVITEQRAPQADPCSGRPDGIYCACDLDPSANPNTRLACVNGQTFGAAPCSNGCTNGVCNDPGGGSGPPTT